jgi:hypothetical protein
MQRIFFFHLLNGLPQGIMITSEIFYFIHASEELIYNRLPYYDLSSEKPSPSLAI